MAALQEVDSNFAFETRLVNGLCDFPFDILLELVGLLDLQDVISLTKVCRRLREATDDRTFWLCALKTVQESTVLACPTSDDLSKHSKESLRDIALHTHRRNTNLNSNTPRIIGSMTTLSFGGQQEFITEVPGAHRIVTRDLKYGHAICWDVQQGKALHSFYVGLRLFKVTRLLEGPGKLLLVLPVANLKTDDDPTSFVFLRINFGTNPLANDRPLEAVRRHELPRDHEVLTSCSNTQWTVTLNSEEPSLRLFVFNNFTGHTSVIKTNLNSHRRRRVDLSFAGQDLYLFDQRITKENHVKITAVYRCSGDLFSQVTEGGASSVVTWNCDRAFKEYPVSPAVEGMAELKIHETSRSDPEGRLFMTAYQSSYRRVERETVIFKFWSLAQSKGTDSIATVHRFAIPGELRTSFCRGLLFAASYSGCYYVSLGEYGSFSRDWCLRLVRFDMESRECSVRKLPLPSNIHGLAIVKALLFDENLGVLYLLLLDGTVYSIPYA